MTHEMVCSLYRGGTSRALIFDDIALPKDQAQRDALFIRAIGSPDPKQIDGMGGATVTTSKVAVIKKSECDSFDVEYTFAQVIPGESAVDYKANCGNISSAIGPYAIENGYVDAQDGTTMVRIWNTNTQKQINAVVQTPARRVTYDGAYAIPGVLGTGAKIELRFLRPGGSATGKLLPTGNALDDLEDPRFGRVRVSVVDASNLFVFVHAHDLGIQGSESIAQLSKMPELIEKVETIRGIIAQRLGFVSVDTEAFAKSPSVPKIALISPPMPYDTTQGESIAADRMDIQVRMISMKKVHPSYAMTGGFCLAAACVIEGTVAYQILSAHAQSASFRDVNIAHPEGIMDIGVKYSRQDDGTQIEYATGYRTANKLMTGTCYVRDV